jgi:hypothetical protein
MNSGSHLPPFRPSPDGRVPWWIDPGRWNVPSPLAVGAVGLLTVAAAATWWCMRQPPQIGLPALIFVLFSELVVVLGLGAARARAVVWECLARISRLESVLEDLRRIDPPRPELHVVPQAPSPTPECGAVSEAIRRDMALLEERLAESVARVRYDIEDNTLLLVDLLGRSDGAAANRSESA